MRQNVGVAEIRVSNDEHTVFNARSLASCVAVMLYDAESRAGGVVRCPLPSSTVDPQRAEASPSTFVDTGVASLLNALQELGCVVERLQATVVGGANLMGASEVFSVGTRTYESAREAVRAQGLTLANDQRSEGPSVDLEFRLSDGAVVVSEASTEKALN